MPKYEFVSLEQSAADFKAGKLTVLPISSESQRGRIVVFLQKYGDEVRSAFTCDEDMDKSTFDERISQKGWNKQD